PAALWLLDPWHDAFATVLAVLLYRPAADLSRLVLANPAARRHYLGMIRARHRWQWLCRCTGLAQPELAAKNRPAAEAGAVVLALQALAADRPQGNGNASRPHRGLLAVRPRRRHPDPTRPAHRPRAAHCPARRAVRPRALPARHLATTPSRPAV